MSTTTTAPRSPDAPSMTSSVLGDERGVMRGVSWNLYERLTDAIVERSSIRVAFDGKHIEIIVLGPFHENLGGSGDRDRYLTAKNRPVWDLQYT